MLIVLDTSIRELPSCHVCDILYSHGLRLNADTCSLNTRKRLRIDRMYSSERDQNGVSAGLPYSSGNKSRVSVCFLLIAR